MNPAVGAAAAVAGMLLTPLIVMAATPGSPAAAGACAVTGAGSPVTGPWDGLDAGQIQVAETIAAVVQARRLPAQATLVAEMTARQESALRNLGFGDTAGPDSRGIFQQRPSWGPLAARENPAAATGLFLDRLVNVAGWSAMRPEHAAHLVQVNAREGDYSRWVPWASAVTAAVAHGPGVLVSCTGSTAPTGSGHGNNVAGQTTIPAGLTLTGSPAGDHAAAWALGQMGKPYIFGAAGPAAFDCSGLTMAAWASQGITLPHNTVAQQATGTGEPTDLSAAVSGDLVLIPGSDGTPAAPGHVGMIAGTTFDGHRWIVQAPMTGIPVEITDSSEWTGQIVAVRRIG